MTSDLADWEKAVEPAPAFFSETADVGGALERPGDPVLLPADEGESEQDDTPKNKSLVFISSGDPRPASSRSGAETILDGISGLNVYAFQINNADTTDSDAIDNTATDGVPNITAADSEVVGIESGSQRLCAVDINPAHILRHTIVSPKWGGDGDDSVVDDTNFRAAADLFFDEGMGVTILGSVGSKLEFQRQIQKQADCALFQDPVSGTYKIKPIRADYDVNTLHVFDQDNIAKWHNLEKPRQRELPSQVTVQFTRRDNGEQDSVQMHNIAAIQQTGYTSDKTVDYPGVSYQPLASRIAARDMSALTVPLWKGKIDVFYLPSDLNLGSAIIIHEPDLGMNSVVCRINEINYGDGKNNFVRIDFTEDKFTLRNNALVTPDVILPPDERALAPDVRFVQEMPYWSMVQLVGETDTATSLSQEPDLGLVAATCNRPNNRHTAAVISLAAGANYASIGESGFAAVAYLSAGVSKNPTATVLTIPYSRELNSPRVNSLIAINDEIMRVDSAVNDEGVVTLNVGRGALDTVPAEHSAGDPVIFWSDAINLMSEDFEAGETASFKVLPRTAEQVLRPLLAEADEVTFASRAIRPYPAGDFQINGGYQQDGSFVANSVFTWVDRDRTLQTTSVPEDFLSGDVGPEAGVAYSFRIEAFDSGGNSLGVYSTTDKGTTKTHTVTDLGGAPGGTAYVEFFVVPVRDGYEAWQSYRYRREAIDVRITHESETRASLGGDLRAPL